MLSLAIKFEEVFPMFKNQESLYQCCPNNEDWEKVKKKIVKFLDVSNAVTKLSLIVIIQLPAYS